MEAPICLVESLVYKDNPRDPESYSDVSFEGVIEEGEAQETGQQIIVGCSVEDCAAELEFFRDTPESNVGDLNVDSLRVCKHICKMRRR